MCRPVLIVLGLLHVDFFRQLAVEIHRFDVHVVEFEVFSGGKSKENVQRVQVHCRHERIREVDARDLGKSLSDESCAISGNTTIISIFGLEHPF